MAAYRLLNSECFEPVAWCVFEEAEWKSACAVVKRPKEAGEPTLSAFILGKETGTTDFTDYTDFEYVMLPSPLTQEVNFLTAISNPILSVKSV